MRQRRSPGGPFLSDCSRSERQREASALAFLDTEQNIVESWTASFIAQLSEEILLKRFACCRCPTTKFAMDIVGN
jgi:hypothetical protein